MEPHKRRIICKKIGVAAAIALAFLLITLLSSDISIPLSSEKMLFKKLEFLKQSFSQDDSDQCSILDSVLLIDTHYAQTLVTEHEGMDTLGYVPVTDRRLLLRLLQHLSKDTTYRYILLDISLDKVVRQEEDTTLYRLIASMPRIGIAMPPGGKAALADSCLISKAGEVGYYVTQWENDFVKFPYLLNGKKSLPLKMYEDLTGRTINRYGVFYTDKTLVRSSVFLTYDFVDCDYRHNLNEEDLDAENKYVLIGDFEEDVHSTYVGELPGVIINFDAYLALIKGHHKIKGGMVVILFVAFFLLAYQTLTQSKFTWLFMWIGYPVFLTILCFVVYCLYNEVYDILITTSLFYLMKTIVECVREYELIRKRIAMVAQTTNNCCSYVIHYVGMGVSTITRVFKLLASQIKRIWKVKTKSK